MNNDPEIINIKRDISRLDEIATRLGVLIEKLTDVSSNTSQVLAVQDLRLASNEKATDGLKNTIEHRRIENNTNYKHLEDKIGSILKEIEKDTDDKNEKIVEEIKRNREETNEHVKQLTTRIDRIEKYFFIGAGVVIVLTFLLQQIDFSTILK